MSDLIERQAAIDAAIEAVDEWDGGCSPTRADMIADAINNTVPSAQPESHDKRTETHACDTISRQAAIDVLNDGAELWRRVLDEPDVVGIEREKYKWGLGLIESYISDMKELPPAQPEQRWIPCSERLPEDYDDVLVWFEYFRYGNYNCMYQTYGISNYSRRSCSWMINHESGWHKLRVIAWMPLPEPYREEGG